MGKIFYIMGKSAAGKDHIYSLLAENEELHLKKMILYTTRPIREGEENGREYFFTGEETRNRFREEGRLIEERSYHTIHGIWTYYTADDGQVNLEKYDYIGIGTLESFVKLKEYYGEDLVLPIYIEVEDGERLSRALFRERQQSSPKYSEMCRRFLADAEDFSEQKIQEAGIIRRFENKDLKNCTEEIILYIKAVQNEK